MAVSSKSQVNNTFFIKKPIEDSKRFLQKTFRSWLDRRIPPSNKVVLNHQRIFILPSRQGIYYGLVIIALFIGGVNYENSLILALCFLLASVGQLATLLTYRNLSGLCIQAGHTENSFAGDKAAFNLSLSRLGKRRYEALKITWDGSVPQTVDLLDNINASVKIFIPVERRGVFKPGRLKIESYYPLGILRTWTLIDMDMECLVYPKPIFVAWINQGGQQSIEGELVNNTGDDDFDGLRKYVAGDSLKQVAWKNLARGQGLHTKAFMGYADQTVWLDWHYFADKDPELRASALCYWVLKLSESKQSYGLRLPDGEIKPANGLAHKRQCLEALALINF